MIEALAAAAWAFAMLFALAFAVAMLVELPPAPRRAARHDDAKRGTLAP